MRILVWLIFLAMPLAAQVAEEANRNYQTSQQRATMAARLSGAARAEALHAADIIKAIELKPGMSVADVGTGAGAMLPSLSEAVGAEGKVYAMDIFPDFLAKAKEASAKEGLKNIQYFLGTDRDPNLPTACCDVALTIDAYHHYDYPGDTLTGLRRALKKGGRLVIVEYYKRPGAMGATDATQHIRLDKDDLVKEVTANGFRLVRTQEHVPGSQYIAIFEVSVQ
jgi:ubiquinone/menaquinone biosynthesis C-methylase UbiE